jgi:hypothetical protein
MYYIIIHKENEVLENLSENCLIDEDIGASEVNQGKPVLGLLTSTGKQTASLRQPIQSTFSS